MTHVHFSKVLNVAPQAAWRLIRDFGALPDWFPFVKRSELRGGGPFEVGVIRANTVEDGSVIEERLLELSDRDRRVVYDIVAADIPTKNYSAILQVHDITAEPGRCFVDWSADFDVEGDPGPAVEWVRDGIFRTCLEELECVTGGSPSSASPGSEAERNRGIVRQAFQRWAEGGSVFDILDDDVEWTIAGSGASAQTFRGKTAFLEGGLGPVAGRFAEAIQPHILGLHADGDHVVIRWDGVAPLKDGQTYRNSYAWFFQMRDGRVVKATAFLDLPTYEAAIAGGRLPPWPAA